MWHLSWEALRAYLSPILVTILALVGLWKDASDYRDLVKSGPSQKGIRQFAKKNIVGIICVLTILLSVLAIFDTHAARVASRNAETDAKLDKKASEIQVNSLQDQIAGLRQDGTTNARTFSDSFSQLNSKFSDLQSKVQNQDLMDQLASTRAELQATQKKLEPKPKAILESTFVGEGVNSNPQTPIKVTQAKVENGVITVRLSVYNHSDSDGLDGALKVVVCDACKFAEEPASFQHLADDPIQAREYDFQRIFAHTKVQSMTIKISVPETLSVVQLKTVVICETCDHRRDEDFAIKLVR